MNDLNGSKPDLGSRDLNSSKPTSLSFDPPPTNPIPVPDLATLPEPDVWAFLGVDQAIDDPDALALHVAQLTAGMAELKRRIDEIVWVDEQFIRSLLERIENERGKQ